MCQSAYICFALDVTAVARIIYPCYTEQNNNKLRTVDVIKKPKGMLQEVKINTFREETKSCGAHMILHEDTEFSRVKHLLPPTPPS